MARLFILPVGTERSLVSWAANFFFLFFGAVYPFLGAAGAEVGALPLFPMPFPLPLPLPCPFPRCPPFGAEEVVAELLAKALAKASSRSALEIVAGAAERLRLA